MAMQRWLVVSSGLGVALVGGCFAVTCIAGFEEAIFMIPGGIEVLMAAMVVGALSLLLAVTLALASVTDWLRARFRREPR